MALSGDTVGLIFRLDADSKPAQVEIAQFKNIVQTQISGLQQSVSSSFSQIGQSISGLVSPIGLVTVALAGLGVGLLSAAKQASDLGDQIDDMRQSTGLSAETLSALNVAAGQEEKSLDSLGFALKSFNVAVSNAQRGNKELQSIFNQLGVDLRGSTDQAFRQAVDRFKELEGGANKTAVGVKLFGRGVGELIPILNDMQGGIDGGIQKAKELGLFFTNEGAASAAEYKNQLILLNQEFDGLKVRIGTAVIPALTQVLNLLNQGGRAFSAWIDGAKDATEQLEILGQKAFSMIFGGPPRVTTPSAAKPPPEIELPKIGKPKKEKKEKELQEFFDARDIAKLQAKLQREELEREVDLIKIREAAEREHLRNMEQLDQESAQRTIEIIQREAEQRVITEQQAAEQIGAIRIAAFANREKQLKTEIDKTREALANVTEAETRAELLAKEQEFVDELELLQQRRAKAEEDAVNAVIDARRRDIEDLIRSAEEQRRLRQQQLQEEGFGAGAAGAIAGLEQLLGRTLSVREQLNAVLQGIVADAQTTLPSLGAVFVQTASVIADSFATMISALVSGQASIRQAVAAFFKAALAPLKDYLMKKAKIQFAEGLADLAYGNYAGAAKHFLAGAALSAAAGLIDVGSAAIAGGGAVAPSASLGGGISQQQGQRIIEQGDRQPQPIIIQIRTEDGMIVERLRRDYIGNGPSRQLIRRDILGEQPA